MNTFIQERDDWHMRYLLRAVEDLHERSVKGERELTVSTDWLERVLAEDIGLHQRCQMLESRLCEIAAFNFPVTQKIAVTSLPENVVFISKPIDPFKG